MFKLIKYSLIFGLFFSVGMFSNNPDPTKPQDVFKLIKEARGHTRGGLISGS